MHALEYVGWWIPEGGGVDGPDQERPSPRRAPDALADLLATLAEGRRAREAAERRMAEEPAEVLEDILGASSWPPVAVFIRSPGAAA